MPMLRISSHQRILHPREMADGERPVGQRGLDHSGAHMMYGHMPWATVCDGSLDAVLLIACHARHVSGVNSIRAVASGHSVTKGFRCGRQFFPSFEKLAEATWQPMSRRKLRAQHFASLLVRGHQEATDGSVMRPRWKTYVGGRRFPTFAWGGTLYEQPTLEHREFPLQASPINGVPPFRQQTHIQSCNL